MYKKTIFGSACLLGVLSITSCSTMNSMLYKNKCTGSAEALGESQGALLLGPESYNSWAERCQQFGVTLDKGQYIDGLEKGISKGCETKGSKDAIDGRESSVPTSCTSEERKTAYGQAYSKSLDKYCNADKAMALGKKGKTFNGKICPDEAKPDLRKAYLIGEQSKKLEIQRNKLRKEVADYNKKLKNPNLPLDLRTGYTNMIVEKKVKIAQIDNELANIKVSNSSNLGW